jgi:hypothetical protein
MSNAKAFGREESQSVKSITVEHGTMAIHVMIVESGAFNQMPKIADIFLTRDEAIDLARDLESRVAEMDKITPR